MHNEIELSVVVLGDACIGKTSILKRLCGYEVSTQYEPTVGTEMITCEAKSKREEMIRITFWDYSGNERFQSVFGSTLVMADVCLLVYDTTNESSLNHLNAWHDEFLQTGLYITSPPAFIVVGNKIDCSKRVRTESGIGWCGAEYVDPTQWPREIVQDMLPSPPFVEVSAREGSGMSILLSTITERGLMRLRLSSSFVSRSIGDMKLIEETVSSGAIRCILLGDAEMGKEILVAPEMPQFLATSEVVERTAGSFHRITSGQMQLAVWTCPTSLQTESLTFCRGAHVCILVVKLGVQAPIHRIGFWKECFLREAGIRDPASVAWVVVGHRGNDYIQDASLEATKFCITNNFCFLDLPQEPSSALVSSCWSQIVNYTVQLRAETTVQRAAEQIDNFVGACSNIDEGCDWQGRACELQAHIRTCGFEFENCRFDGCSTKMYRKDRAQHEMFCEHRPPLCHFCEKPYTTTLYEHLALCEKKSEFEKSNVPCPLAEFGCPEHFIPRNAVSQHLSQDIPKHIELLSRASHTLKQDMLFAERRHYEELQNQKAVHDSQIEHLKSLLSQSQETMQQQAETIADLKLELKVLWDEIHK